MRLNVGCRDKVFDGDWCNVDAVRGPAVHVQADAFRLPFRDASLEEVFASDILEHAPWARSLAVLREWHRVLRPGGVLKVKTPNLRSLAREIGAAADPSQTRFLVRKIYGGQEQGGDFHYAGFTPDLLEDFLKVAGFTGIKIRPEGDGGDALNMSVRAVRA
jgi:predicted SAM-dependent methyltransferase